MKFRHSLAIWVACHCVSGGRCGYCCGLYFSCSTQISTRMSQPTYKDLIELLSEAERDQSGVQSTAELLTVRFCELYPHITVSRPGRFLATVRQIASPVERLRDPARKAYLKRHWSPRIRNTGMHYTVAFIRLDSVDLWVTF